MREREKAFFVELMSTKDVVPDWCSSRDLDYATRQFVVRINGVSYTSSEMDQVWAENHLTTYWGNFAHVERLWRDNQDRWLLAGSGMESTVWAADPDGSGTLGGGVCYVPLTKFEAVEWLRMHGVDDLLTS